MEILLTLAFLLFLVYFISDRWVSSKTHPKHRRETQYTDLKKSISPFDSKSAKPVLDAIVLDGYAFVVDGDTIVIRKTQIRLFGIDAPELNHPYEIKAKRALVSLCNGKLIRAEVHERDNYGRTVAKCYLPDGSDLSAEMVKLGLAIDWPKFSGGTYKSIERPDARKKLWLADARQKGRMHVWQEYEEKQKVRLSENEK